MKKEIAIGMFFEIHRMFHDTLHKKGGLPLSMPQGMTIMFIGHNESTVLKDIAQKFNITNASASVMIKKLEKQGLLCREENKEDKRSVILKVTKEGKMLMAKVKAQMLEAVLPLFEDIEDFEADELVRIFKKITDQKTHI